MSTYLHVASGAFGFLIDIEQVMEVTGIDTQQHGDASGRRAWREKNLPLIDLARVIGVRDSRAQQQVVLLDAQHEAACLLAVEKIPALLEIDDTALHPLTEITTALAQLVDAAWPTDGGRCLLRLRTPFAWPETPTHGATTP